MERMEIRRGWGFHEGADSDQSIGDARESGGRGRSRRRPSGEHDRGAREVAKNRRLQGNRVKLEDLTRYAMVKRIR